VVYDWTSEFVEGGVCKCNSGHMYEVVSVVVLSCQCGETARPTTELVLEWNR